MKIRLLAVLVCFTLLGLTPAMAKKGPATAALSTEIGKQGPSFDGRQWFVGYHTAQGNNSLTEYVLSGEKVESWTELVTVEEMIGGQIMPMKDFFAAQAMMLKRKCPEINFKLISKDKDEMLYEWQTSACSGEAFNESEISRVKYLADRIMILHYASKKPISYGHREVWIGILNSALFQPSKNVKKQ